ncbi:hypothetical protein C8R41DRAFT_54753 [Lentinula lateritia]|uniref:DNA-binding protein RAP1 n=1 Tax=Lentinula lateritia TaxID=40482 RepID=A0ABQ8V3P2_9AGAR|nr:hypothetical protein C8R41DRAFT_54753 [Lentinula lateritia]
MKFTEDDDSFLVQFIAESHSEFKGRKGELLYKKLVQQHADPRHSWKSWQHYYVKHADYFDHLIEQYQLEHSISIPPTVTNQIRKRYGFTEAEDALLVEHIAKNDLSGQRKGLSLYNVLSQRDGKQHERSSKSWCHRYSKNADYFDRLVDIYRREHNVNKHLISTLGTPADSSSETSIGISSPSTSRSRPSASLPLLSAPKSTRFKREEDMDLVAYLSENTSLSPGLGLDERNSFKLYSNLTRSNARSWAASRSANSWFIRYTSNMAYFETLIEQYRLRNSTTPCVTLGKRKRDPRVLPSSSTSASSLFEDNSFIGKEDNRQRISYRPRKRLCGSGSSGALDGDASGDAIDKAGTEYNRDEDHNKAYRRSKRLPAAPSSRSHGSDNSGEESDNEEETSAPIEETGSLGRAGSFQWEGAHTLSSLTMRFTRRRLRNSRAQDNDQDEDDDLIEVDSYLRGCSVESNMQECNGPAKIALR